MNPSDATERDARRRKGGFARRYLLLVGVPLAGLVMVLTVGASVHAVVASGKPDAAVGSQGGGTFVLSLLLLQVTVILLVVRGVSALLGGLGQPRVVGEMVAGIMLGPSLLGSLAPGVYQALFPAFSLRGLEVLSQLGTVLFMFIVGLEVDPSKLRGCAHAAVLTSHASITAPFLLGSSLALILYPSLAGPGVGFAQFALFVGAAMSVTAFPVLARILAERQLVATRLGSMALTCAAVDDVTAWCILAAVAALARTTSEGLPIWLTAVGTVAFAALVLTVGPRAFARIAAEFDRRGRLTTDMTALVIVALLGGAWVTERLGVHGLFGAFIVGVAMPKTPALVRALLDRFEDILLALLLPLFFASTGLRTRLGLIEGRGLWVVCAAVVAVAIAGKLGGSAVAARMSGLGWRESAAVGVLMNTRGLIELVFLNVGLDLGIISPALFAIMVTMALITTVMTTPLLAVVWPPAARVSVTRIVGHGSTAEAVT